MYVSPCSLFIELIIFSVRDLKRALEGEAAVAALPATVLDPFPFSLSFADQRGYYDGKLFF